MFVIEIPQFEAFSRFLFIAIFPIHKISSIAPITMKNVFDTL